jgi:hypothetical protein
MYSSKLAARGRTRYQRAAAPLDDCWQCDQIGRIFAQWGIVYFEQCFENYKSIKNIWATFYHGTSY